MYKKFRVSQLIFGGSKLRNDVEQVMSKIFPVNGVDLPVNLERRQFNPKFV